MFCQGTLLPRTFLFSKLLKCKLSSIFEIAHIIPTCDIVNETKRKTTTCYRSSLQALRFTTCMYLTLSRSFHFSNWKHHSICGVSIFNFLYPICPHLCLTSKCCHLHSRNPHCTPISPQGFCYTCEYEDHCYMDERIVKTIKNKGNDLVATRY